MFDLAIIGSSFTGSLLSQVAHRLGKKVLLLERGRHPRFAIGESSTPLTNLYLEETADAYELPWLRSFSKWGTWRAQHPEIRCGLKRGFSFFFHQPGEPWSRPAGRGNELLVAASPSEAIADTHWYRPDFDAHLVAEAQRMGVEYVDEIQLDAPMGGPGSWRLRGRRKNEFREYQAAYLVDASGPRGYLSRSWELGEETWPELPATQSLFAHFRDVRPWRAAGAAEWGAELEPFAPDDAALHHVFPGGWIWVLRFNHGVTSAGCAVTDALAAELRLSEGEPAWQRLLARFPAVQAQFRGALTTHPFTHLPRLSYRAARTVGEGSCLLPGTAGFVDPLLSTGFILSLMGVDRLGRLWREGQMPNADNYGTSQSDDLSVTASLVGALYRTFADPAAFRALSLLYFAAASFSETARRLGRPEMAPGFLLREHPEFAPGFQRCVAAAGHVSAAELRRWVEDVITPMDVAGLCKPGKRNWYGCDAADLYANAAKLRSHTGEIEAMLRRVGFVPG